MINKIKAADITTTTLPTGVERAADVGDYVILKIPSDDTRINFSYFGTLSIIGCPQISDDLLMIKAGELKFSQQKFDLFNCSILCSPSYLEKAVGFMPEMDTAMNCDIKQKINFEHIIRKLEIHKDVLYSRAA